MSGDSWDTPIPHVEVDWNQPIPSDAELGWAPSGEKSYGPWPVAVAPPSLEERSRRLPPDTLANENTDISQIFGAPYTLVDSQVLMTSMLDALSVRHPAGPMLSVDLEGLELGKSNGETYLLQIYDSRSEHLYIVDICVLSNAAFSTPASDGETTLKVILESAEIPKLFFDVRRDAYALFIDFDIRLNGVVDLQNVQMASRLSPSGRKWRLGLPKLIEKHAGFTDEEKEKWNMYKKQGQGICRKGGYDQFSVRPLRKDLLVYAGNDVLLLPKMHSELIEHISQERLDSADIETRNSIIATQDPAYNPDEDGEDRTAAHWYYRQQGSARFCCPSEDLFSFSVDPRARLGTPADNGPESLFGVMDVLMTGFNEWKDDPFWHRYTADGMRTLSQQVGGAASAAAGGNQVKPVNEQGMRAWNALCRNIMIQRTQRTLWHGRPIIALPRLRFREHAVHCTPKMRSLLGQVWSSPLAASTAKTIKTGSNLLRSRLYVLSRACATFPALAQYKYRACQVQTKDGKKTLNLTLKRGMDEAGLFKPENLYNPKSNPLFVDLDHSIQYSPKLDVIAHIIRQRGVDYRGFESLQLLSSLANGDFECDVMHEEEKSLDNLYYI